MIGSPRVHHRSTDSTNERAKDLALRGAPHGTLVTADAQTAGRGRQGRAWQSPPGAALLMSLVVRDFGAARAHLPLAAAVAVCEACEHVAAVSCAIKWPNDVWAGGLKLAGILIEGRPQEGWAVLGIGVNVATTEAELPEELRGIATSLAIASEAPEASAPDREALLGELLERLDAALAATPAQILTRSRARDALQGRPVRWQSGEGTAAGIDDSGALLVQTASGRVTLDAGEVHLLRPKPMP